MTSDSHTADAGESTGQVDRPGPLVHRGAVAPRPRTGTSELLPPLVARHAAREAPPGEPDSPSGEAAGHALDPAARDFLVASGAGAAEAEPVAGSDFPEADDATTTASEASSLEEADLPWLMTPEDEDELDSGSQEPTEDDPARSGREEAPATGTAGADAPPGDPTLRVAERLERIATSLRTRGASGPLIEQPGDPLAALVTGYLLGITESKGH